MLILGPDEPLSQEEYVPKDVFRPQDYVRLTLIIL